MNELILVLIGVVVGIALVYFVFPALRKKGVPIPQPKGGGGPGSDDGP